MFKMFYEFKFQYSFSFILLLASVASSVPVAEPECCTGGGGLHTGWFTWTCSCNNPATKQTYSMSPLCEQAGGKIDGNTCTFQADNDLKGPTIFTNDKCAAQYGASYHGSCSMEGFYSICPGPGGCPLPPTQQSDCPASAGVPNFCAAAPQCVGSQLRCDFGDLGYCIWGACQCSASGWTVTGKVASRPDCSNQHFPLLL